MKKLIHTPEGVRDLYNTECAKKETIENLIRSQIRRYGYRDIQTPTFEFFDIFSKEKGSVSSKELFKFFDREGETLVLRPDITPSVARAAAKYYMEDDMPIRLSYCGNTFINHSGYQGRLKEQTQIGAELIGDGSPQADAELIALMVRCLLKAGLKDFQIEIGNVDFFYGFLHQANLTEEDVIQLKSLIESKNLFGAEDLLSSQTMDSGLRETILKLPELFGGYEILEKAKVLANNDTSAAAVARLEQIYQILCYYKVEDHVNFDLGMIGNYQYYTGVIFRGITYGTGESIVTGGRYDHLLAQYGKDACSIGFAIRLDLLLTAMERQKISIPFTMCESIFLYSPKVGKEAILLSEQMRKEGIMLTMIEQTKALEEYITYGKANGFAAIYHLTEENQKPTVYRLQEGA